MSINFYNTYIHLEKTELFKVVLFPDDYQHEAVIVAKQVIAEKGWTEDFNTSAEELNANKKTEEEAFEQDVIEKAEYYKNVVEFKNQGNSFQVRIPDMPKFEAALSERGIDFFREDKNIGVQLDSYPTQTYFFKNEDCEIVDKITKELGLITAPYADIKPFFIFEIKVVLVIIALIALALIIF